MINFVRIAGLAFLLAGAAIVPSNAQTPTALSGQVTSGEEGAMEGVLVNAKRADAPVTVTVVSDAQGNFSFPAAKLAAGRYSISIRAVGYDLDGKPTVDVAADRTAHIDLKLRKTRKLASQLTNAEWMESVPGTAQQKGTFFNCVSCHTVERM